PSSRVALIVLMGLGIALPSLAEPPPPSVDFDTLIALDDAKLGKLALNDPLLKLAYTQLFLTRFGESPEWREAIARDLERRGNAAIPLLLQLFADDNQGDFRIALMRTIEQYPSIEISPFLSAARDTFQKEGLNLSVRTCYAMAWLLERHGDASDLSILRQML